MENRDAFHMDFAQRRKAKGLRQVDVAGRLHRSKQQVYRIENGLSDPYLSVLLDMTDIVGEIDIRRGNRRYRVQMFDLGKSAAAFDPDSPDDDPGGSAAIPLNGVHTDAAGTVVRLSEELREASDVLSQLPGHINRFVTGEDAAYALEIEEQAVAGEMRIEGPNGPMVLVPTRDAPDDFNPPPGAPAAKVA